MEITISNKIFAEEVKKGLSGTEKRLSSKYFYDAIGDELFQRIMKLPEYYLTRAEFDILDHYKQDILKPWTDKGERFNLVELGAGDGLKTRILISFLYEKQIPFTYYPIDISGNALGQLESALGKEFPELPVVPIQGTYHDVLKTRAWNLDYPSLMLFLGSNLGNFMEEEALHLLETLSNALDKGEMLLAGFDLKKDPEIVLNAYNDSQGVTRDFNLNLLHRINRELGGDFNADLFQHWPVYNPATGECKSYLVSKAKQTVTIEALGQTFQFEESEPIFTEISKKYSLQELQQHADKKGFKVVRNFLDDAHYFADSLWEKIG